MLVLCVAVLESVGDGGQSCMHKRHPHYQVNSEQYVLASGTENSVYFTEFSISDCTQTYAIVSSVCNVVNGCFSGVSVDWVYSTIILENNGTRQ